MIDTTPTHKSKKVAACIKKLPPCNNICPAGEDIQLWISLAKEKKFHEAWQVIMQSNPFPAIHGRICYHYCETGCNRIQYDETVGIHCIERFLGDMALTENWIPQTNKKKTGKKILIVGAGPAGLSASFYLRLMGYDVTIYEALSQPGGTMLVGIPAYRLPREILSGEVNRILNMGIKIEYNHKVEDVLVEKEKGVFDAVFLAIGAHLGKNMEFPMENPCRIIDAIDYLHGVSFGKPPQLGSRLVIYGGGNTAIDVARSAKRLGVSEITVIYHRTREKMSAFPNEVEEALEEGIKFIFLRSIMRLDKNTLTLNINDMDDKDRPKNTGEVEKIETDTLIFALSQIPDSEFLRKIPQMELQPNGVVMVDNFFMTGYNGIFAGGDMIPYDRSVTVAVGQGRQAAYYVDAYLHDTVCSKSSHRELASFDKLHISDEKSQKIKQKVLDIDTRIKSFDEVLYSCSQDEILYEASRCFSCGNCFGCGKCYAICPVQVIAHSELDKKVTNIDTENCIGCAKCFKVCPCGAFVMLDRQNN